ncbi:hypothetical protein FHW96_000244 [Novosphingobium sp. SG751A]|uniref:hypothetical protein n=1 Tax=Novosphingobium sp. SG751A TaxID=2587000 RepID=UPI001556E80A|nr:hypothetical protein [Novosphingobium sp. SG751A]NOW44117.1 hypothetical protein [Novosphingobium sp. SG751A]
MSIFFERGIVAWRRVPFGGASGDADIVVLGLDWSDATYAMQIRAAPGDTGDPLVSLANAAAGSQGISAAYDADYVHPITGATVGATTIRPQIDETTMEGLPVNPDDPASPIYLWWDMHVTAAGLPKAVFCQGKFTVDPGVTI